MELGPVLPEEADLLTALTKMMAPLTVVEFGFLGGDSARAFLRGMPAESGAHHVFSYDIISRPGIGDPRHTVITKDMRDFDSNDIGGRAIDFLYFDASHLFEDSVRAFEKARTYLTYGALVIVHDTGFWNVELMPAEWPGLMKDGGHPFEIKQGLIRHCPGEHEFVSYLEQVCEMRSIGLNPTHVLRHGLTILQ